MHILASWLLPAGAVAAFTVAACGGRVVVDGSGGMTGTGGTSSSGAGASTATASSSSATSASSSASSAGGGCPAAPFPSIEGSCAQEGQICKVPNACCGGQAACKGGFWTFDGPLCNMLCSPQCGPDGFSCAHGKICVTLLGKTTTYQCADDPCGGMLDCACAVSLCKAAGLVCNNTQDGFKVLCDCNGPCN